MHRIEPRIQPVRGVSVIIDADLADFQGVPTRVLTVLFPWVALAVGLGLKTAFGWF